MNIRIQSDTLPPLDGNLDKLIEALARAAVDERIAERAQEEVEKAA